MDSLPINALDIFILIVVILSAIVGIVRGFVREVLSVAAWVGAVWLTMTFYPQAREYMMTLIESEFWAEIAAGGGLFLIILVIFSIIAKIIGNSVQNNDLIGPLNRTLGLGFGVLRGMIILTILNVIVLRIAGGNIDEPEWVADSALYPYVEQSTEFLTGMVPEEFVVPKMPKPNITAIGNSGADSSDEFGYTADDDIGQLIEQELKNQLAPEAE